MTKALSRAGLEPTCLERPSRFQPYTDRDFGDSVPHAAYGYVRGRSYRSTNALKRDPTIILYGTPYKKARKGPPTLSP